MKSKGFQIQKKRVAFFAPWAVICKPFSEEKHVLDGTKICYTVTPGVAYANHIEMAGFFADTILSYGAKANGSLRTMRHVTFPTLRLYPNLTSSSFSKNFKGVSIRANGKIAREKACRFVFDGILHMHTRFQTLDIERAIFSAVTCKACVERIQIVNNGKQPSAIQLLDKDGLHFTPARHGVDRQVFKTYVQMDESACTLQPGESKTFFVAYCAAKATEAFKVSCVEEFQARQDFLTEMEHLLVIETPDNRLNVMTYYAKIRAAESIFETKAGLMHAPGGGGYYAALWTNDQCEYVNPLFAYLGYAAGRAESLNCYALYQNYIAPDKALISSIIAEGDGIWHGAGDRGDSAMYAYGCSRFLLTLGDESVARKYRDGIRDCLTYTLSRTNAAGVIQSDSDELENRFESGDANLCTSCLAYDALLSAAMLEQDLGDAAQAEFYREKAAALQVAIEAYFGSTVEGYETYRYCAQEPRLRSWIAMPLVVGISNRAAATVKALLSPALRKNEGLVTRAGEKTFWDRSTLYALRGLFYSNFANDAMPLLEVYSRARLLGEHIPYAVEAFPEGNQAQLSAESGLYLRIFTEGILGYRPTGLHTFEICPHLPEKWKDFSIHNMLLCGESANIRVQRYEASYKITITTAQKEQVFTGEKAAFSV